MMVTRRVSGALFSLLCLTSACDKREPEVAQAAAPLAQAAAKTPAELRAMAKALFGALPERAEHKDYPLTDAKTALGKTLYFENRISKNQDLSCASCHALDGFGADTRPEAIERGTSFGHKTQFGDRNSPTVFNSALQFVQFWDGRAADVEEQAKGPVLNPVEMAMPSEDSVVAVLKSIPGYEPLFKAAFPESEDAITYTNMVKAIGAFERLLITPAPFDRFLGGDDSALSQEQLEGLDTFVGSGCIACHTGPLLGGGMYQKLGLIKPFETKDEGRSAISGNAADKYFFKVPMLRNIEKTAPYFHDGSVKTLEDAVKLMAVHQTPQGALSDDKVSKLVAFLRSLTGELPKALSEPSELPASGPKTPKADPS